MGTVNPTVYDALDELRRLRNRVHIQNEQNDFERDDSAAFFTSERKLRAEKALEKTIKALAQK